MKPGALSIVFSADYYFSVPLGVAVYSLLKNALPGRVYDIHVLDGGVRDDVKKDIEAWKSRYAFTISYHDLSGSFKELDMGCGLFTPAMFYRFLIPELLDPSIRRAFYVDSDVLFLADCGELFTMPMEGKCLGAVQDLDLTTSDAENRHRRLGVDLGWESERSYFLSGQLLMDLERMRCEKVTERLVHHAAEHSGRYQFPDQDVMNVVLEGEIATLPYKWCVMPYLEERVREAGFGERLQGSLYSLAEIREGTDHPALLHFAGGNKPDVTSPPRQEAERVFLHYLQQTPWAGELPYVPACIREAARLRAGKRGRECERRLVRAMSARLGALRSVPGGVRGYKLWLKYTGKCLSRWRRFRSGARW